MTRALTLVVPGRLDARTGGSIYNRRMAEAMRARGWEVAVAELPGDFPQPSPAALEDAARVLAGLPTGRVTVIDGLALSAMPDAIEGEGTRLRIVALVHLPIAAAVGLDERTARRYAAMERRAMAAAALVVVTGAATLPLLAPYGLPPARVVVVEPGTDHADLARGSGGPHVGLLSVATLNPGKGHEVLLRAMAALPAVWQGAGTAASWRLVCAGSDVRHPATAARVRALTRALALDDRVTFTGDLDAAALARCYDGADVFVLATLRETWGMAVAEALARGLPVVSTTTGAIPSLVGPDAGVLVPPRDEPALAGALARVIGDVDLRARLAAGARRTRERLATWDIAARHLSEALEGHRW